MQMLMDGMQDAADEVEQVEVAAKAQVLMDCGADMISHEGLRAFKAMHDMSLQRIPSTLQWQVKGRKATEAEGEAVRLLHAPCMGNGCCLPLQSGDWQLHVGR